MRFHILTLFPEFFEAFVSTSIIGRAVEAGCVSVDCVHIRDFSDNKHRKVDDAPFGGGAGMVMAVQPLRDALLSLPENPMRHVIYLSPRGKPLTQSRVKALSELSDIVLVCGHYEGVDQRFIDAYVDEELSIGDYVLTGGEPAAMVVIDSVTRLLDSVLSEGSVCEESFEGDLLEYPQYTRPTEVDGMSVPDVLLSGHHAHIEAWRLERSIELTKAVRPDLFERFCNRPHTKETLKILKKYL